MLADGECQVVVLPDVSAAFDTIDHNILLDLLSSHFRLASTVLSWISCYLAACTQSMSIKDPLSCPQSLECGVPQGSVSDPFSSPSTPPH